MAERDRSGKDGEAEDSLYRAIVDTAVDAIIVIDRRGSVRSLNRAAEEIFGYAASEVVGNNVKMLMPEPYCDEHDGYLDRYQRTGEKRIIGIGREVMGRRKNGSTFPMDLSVGEAHQRGERYFVGIIRDITERKAAELAVRESELRLRSLLDTLPDGIIVIDEKGTIQSCSPSAERLFGYQEAEIVGRNVGTLMPSPYREAHDFYLERYLRTGERRIIGIGRVVVGLRKSGETFPMELGVGEFPFGGQRFFTGFVRDLTDRQQTEKRVQDLQSELLHVSRLSTMGQMASTLAHELNQPLTAITNYLQAARRLVADMPAGLGGVSAAEVMEKAIAQATRAGEVIRRLRGFVAKGEADRRPEALNKVVEEATALALVGAKQFGVRTDFSLDPAVPPVFIDKIQVQQVVLNLVRNAIEAMEGSARRELLVATGMVDDGAAAEVRVSDSGPGLAAEVAAQLFQPFITTKKAGMGLGLSISREIVEAHGGRLVAEPNPTGGLTFRFTLPYVEDEDEA
jgi:two-component system sensor kinase FixL